MKGDFLGMLLLAAAVGGAAAATVTGPALSGGTRGAEEARPLAIDGRDASITGATVAGAQFYPPEIFQGFEDYHNPRLRRLRETYKLDDVVAGETDEFRRLLRLRHWVFSRWPINNNQTFDGDAFAILEKAKTGAGFYCTHSMKVQHAVLTAMGYVSRNLGVDRNHEDFGRSIHHGVNEVWSNTFAKWVLTDAKYDVHYERNGVPLSALEIHTAVRADGAKGVRKVQGIERKEIPMENPDTPEASVREYWWVSYYMQQNSFSQPHWSGNNRLPILDDAGFRETTWYRGTDTGLVKHWAYRANAFLPTRNPHDLDWTPGVVQLRARQASPTELALQLSSATPNLRDYQVRATGGAWRSLPGTEYRWQLLRGTNILELRTRNLFGVEGPILTATVQVTGGR